VVRVAVIAAFGLAGCAQVFGIDETTGPSDAPPAPFMSLPFSTGDLRIRDVPYAVGYFDAGVFTVVAP